MITKSEEILRKCVEKAAKAGWCYYSDNIWSPSTTEFAKTMSEWDNKLNLFIFDHAFAKAFFYQPPENKQEEMFDNIVEDGFYWKFHLQQLALSEDRLAYLSKFID